MSGAAAAAGPRRAPPLEAFLGYGAMAPLALGALAAWLLPPPWAAVALDLAVAWGGAILAFHAGVRRGLSFRAEGGSTAGQVGAALWLFALGFAVMAVPSAAAALAPLILGYLSLAVLDSRAARRGEAPPFFGRLRPAQVAIALASLGALLPLALIGR